MTLSEGQAGQHVLIQMQTRSAKSSALTHIFGQDRRLFGAAEIGNQIALWTANLSADGKPSAVAMTQVNALNAKVTGVQVTSGQTMQLVIKTVGDQQAYVTFDLASGQVRSASTLIQPQIVGPVMTLLTSTQATIIPLEEGEDIIYRAEFGANEEEAE